MITLRYYCYIDYARLRRHHARLLSLFYDDMPPCLRYAILRAALLMFMLMLRAWRHAICFINGDMLLLLMRDAVCCLFSMPAPRIFHTPPFVYGCYYWR